MSSSAAYWTNAFHAHLDVCPRCANRPFDLCPIGADFLRRTAETPSTAQKKPDDPER